jgi:L-cysteine S-thiosulfotransferase
MRRALSMAACAAPLMAGLLALAPAPVAAQGAPAAKPAMPGQALVFDRSKGNCIACHTMAGGDVPSNVGPELNNMRERFPDRGDLVAILTNEEARNPLTMMPPFGRNLILNAREIEQIVDFLYTL